MEKGEDKSKGVEVLSWLEASILVTGCIDEGDAAGFINNNKRWLEATTLNCESGTTLQTHLRNLFSSL